MPDYGHELQFGAFITPAADQPERAVALAEVSEAAGLDLATFQDHPYNPGFLDTWTLLGWVAARTSAIHVTGNVLNVPLRPPGVLARAAASLDRLSGGRLEMGIGAGAFPDAAQGMGAPVRGTGAAIDALSEAIDIMRGVWDETAPGPVRLTGEHHRVQMRRGPAPAHDIGIWLGAYKPKMLRLTGRKADGWLPSYDYVRSPGIRDANKIIDDAAAEAGRDPREIRRLLNLMRPVELLRGDPGALVDRLLPLVLEEGFSTFIVGGDDPRALQILGQEVAPALREAVARERASAGVARTASALARRVPGIDYDGVPASLAAAAVEPGDPQYEQVRHTYIRTGSPALVLRPSTAAEVSDAVGFARAQGVDISVRSGGHGMSGRSTNDGGVIIDLSRMNKVSVLDRATRRVRLEPGARWGNVAKVLAADGLAMSSGDYGDVGVGGLATTAGIGYLSRKYGLTIDHVQAAELVLADGTQVRADRDHHPDLFWAVRGAGGNFGVVTALELTAYEVGDVVFAQLVVDASDPAAVLQAWGALIERAPRELTSFLMMFPGRRAGAPIVQVTLIYAGDDVEAARAAIEPFLAIGPILDQSAQVAPYPAIVAPANNRHVGQGLEDTHSGLLDHITPEVAGALAAMIRSGDIAVVQFRSVGGAVNDVAADETAYPHRHQNFSLLAGAVSQNRRQLDKMWSELREHLDGMYLSFESGTEPELLLEAFPEPALTRLRELKGRYDPDNVFNRNFPIPPLTSR
ncbi:LLM class flavin-dependent oxidoreductase [Actinoplanes sp. TBRC 11911]|uniref:LLM class flavin-dependent oxidoreductase n=1 Tax=Actinoplanes sp. TBRC 11911 TaxID=2729386 RepID=UPI00145D81E9|nr:LLM class flavin-dependent oxidoreductase [Actinoplanes sp. TBRC 11911]NMO51917.1 LLM class flavin-dependent oxidoreductase [Actinoplanes sp. TBRC 11911]